MAPADHRTTLQGVWLILMTRYAILAQVFLNRKADFEDEAVASVLGWGTLRHIINEQIY